jgi:hypothetical protein
VKSSCAPRGGFGITVLTFLIPLADRGWAQAPAEPARPVDPARSEAAAIIVLIAAAGLLLILGVVGKVLDLRLRRDGEAVAVKGLITDALGREPALLRFPLAPTVRVPLWRGSPVTIRVAGQVPSDQLRRDALRRVKRAAATELLVAVRITSRIRVVPTASSAPPLRTARSG